MAFLIPILALMIPISAIVGGYWVKIKKMELEKNSLSPETTQKLQRVLEQNEQLRQRVENLEAIITSLDKELLALRPLDDAAENQQKVQYIVNKLKKS
jgi:uncharacterized protein YlxW (UPF0749 family)